MFTAIFYIATLYIFNDTQLIYNITSDKLFNDSSYSRMEIYKLPNNKFLIQPNYCLRKTELYVIDMKNITVISKLDVHNIDCIEIVEQHPALIGHYIAGLQSSYIRLIINDNNSVIIDEINVKRSIVKFIFLIK